MRRKREARALPVRELRKGRFPPPPGFWPVSSRASDSRIEADFDGDLRKRREAPAPTSGKRRADRATGTAALNVLGYGRGANSRTSARISSLILSIAAESPSRIQKTNVTCVNLNASNSIRRRSP